MPRASKDVLVMRELASRLVPNPDDHTDAEILQIAVATIDDLRRRLAETQSGAPPKPEGVRINARGKVAKKHPWSAADDDLLRECHAKCEPQDYAFQFWQSLAHMMPLRTLGSVEWRCKLLGLPPKFRITSTVAVRKDKHED